MEQLVLMLDLVGTFVFALSGAGYPPARAAAVGPVAFRTSDEIRARNDG